MRFALLMIAIPMLGQEVFTGAPVEREIRGGETQVFTYPVQAGLFLTVHAAELKGTVGLGVAVPGKPLAARGASQYAYFVIGQGGDCRIEIVNPAQSAAKYRLEASTRTPDERDRRRADAFAAMIAGGVGLNTRTKESLPGALAQFETAIREWRAAGEKAQEASALNQAGMVSFHLVKIEQAKNYFESAADVARPFPEAVSTLATALSNAGQAQLTLGNVPMARQRLEEAVAVRKRMGDATGQAVANTNLANVYRRLGELRLAVEAIRQAIALYKQEKYEGAEMIARHNLANIYMDVRNYQGALEEFSAALPFARAKKDETAEYHALHGLSRVYSALGEFALATQFGEKAVAIARQSGTPAILATSLFTLGGIRQTGRDLGGARVLMEESLAVTRKGKTPLPLAAALNGLCQVLVEMGEYAAARPLVEEAIPLNRKVAPATGLPRALACAARIEMAAGAFDAAGKMLEEALAAAVGEEPRVGVLGELARLEYRRGNLLGSLVRLEEAAVMSEPARAGIRDAAVRTTFSAAQAGRAAMHTEVLMALHRSDAAGGYAQRAYEVTERTRARSFAEMVADAKAFAPPARSAAEARRETALAGTITSIQRQLFRDGVSVEQRRVLRRELAEAETELRVFQDQFAGGPAREGEAALDLAAIQSRLLDEKTVLVSYSLGARESYAWAVTREGFASYVLPGRKEIEGRVEGLRKMLTAPVTALTAGRSMTAIEGAARALRAVLLGPLAAELRGKTKLVFVPDGQLHYLPFEVLPGVLEKYQVAYAPSASALAALRKRGEGRAAGGGSLLAMADPVVSAAVGTERGFAFTQLPNARVEAEGIARLFAGARVMVGTEAKEASLKSADLGSFRYLHFATHGYFDEEQPARSGLVLGQSAGDDGFLQAREIFGLKLNADVVTLSACQSGFGRLLAGEGVVGLSRAFFYAGAQGLVVSLWNVNDAATAELMKAFYAGMKEGLGGAEALRRAKASMARGTNRAWRHPYFWAPFVFVGGGV